MKRSTMKRPRRRRNPRERRLPRFSLRFRAKFCCSLPIRRIPMTTSFYWSNPIPKATIPAGIPNNPTPAEMMMMMMIGWRLRLHGTNRFSVRSSITITAVTTFPRFLLLTTNPLCRPISRFVCRQNRRACRLRRPRSILRFSIVWTPRT